MATDRGVARRPDERVFSGRTTAAALGRRSVPRNRFARPAARAFGLRHDFCLARFFSLALGRAPSLFGLSRGGFGRLFGAAGGFRFLCQNDVLLSDRRNSRIRASLACLPVVKTPACGPAKTVKSRRVARAGQPPVFQAPPLRSRPGPAVASDFPAPECATQRFPSATQSLRRR